jgi:catechol 2,3-dioxygenase-like lactoylglutathione lyase family enzyme
MTPSPTRTRPQSHVSIDTADLARSRAFYRALLDAEPVLAKPEYLRFWPEELGLVLSLNRGGRPASGTGALQHLGVLFPDAAALRAARERLAAAGFSTHGAEHVECCYAELDQFWATDPSGVRWELFLAHREVVETPARPGTAAACCAPARRP